MGATSWQEAVVWWVQIVELPFYVWIVRQISGLRADNHAIRTLLTGKLPAQEA